MTRARQVLAAVILLFLPPAALWLVAGPDGALALLAGCAVAGLTASALWPAPRRTSHDALMEHLGHPVPRLPRRWTRADWAELESTTETAKD